MVFCMQHLTQLCFEQHAAALPEYACHVTQSLTQPWKLHATPMPDHVEIHQAHQYKVLDGNVK